MSRLYTYQRSGVTTTRFTYSLRGHISPRPGNVSWLRFVVLGSGRRLVQGRKMDRRILQKNVTCGAETRTILTRRIVVSSEREELNRAVCLRNISLGDSKAIRRRWLTWWQSIESIASRVHEPNMSTSALMLESSHKVVSLGPCL
jgi:hypothetical protein